MESCDRDGPGSATAGIGAPFAVSVPRRADTSSATRAGSGAYLSSPAMPCASGDTIQRRKSRIARALAASGLSGRTSSQVKLAIGYAAGSGESVMDTRKSVSSANSAPAAAAEADSSVGVTSTPARFFTVAYWSWFDRA